MLYKGFKEVGILFLTLPKPYHFSLNPTIPRNKETFPKIGKDSFFGSEIVTQESSWFSVAGRV